MYKPTTILILIIVLVVAAAVVVSLGRGEPSSERGRSAGTEQGQLKPPPGFPQDFPIDPSARLGDGGAQRGPNGEALFTLSTTLSADQAYAMYLGYLESKGWLLLMKSDQSLVKALSAKNAAGQILAVNITPGGGQKTTVNVSLSAAQ